MKIIIVLVILVFFIWYLLKKKKTYQIVVAKYNEDISWLDGYKNVKVYDKFNDKDLPNIGRESHTYLSYIIENYDKLPDVIFFTQGNKSDHYEEPIEYFLNIDDFSKNYKYTKSDDYFITFKISTNKRIYSKDHIYEHRGYELYPMDKLGFRKWFNLYIDEDYDIDDYIYIWWSGIFSVKKEYILSRPKEFYQKLIDYIPKTNDPEVGHYFERSWFYIFNCHK